MRMRMRLLEISRVRRALIEIPAHVSPAIRVMPNCSAKGTAMRRGSFSRRQKRYVRAGLPVDPLTVAKLNFQAKPNSVASVSPMLA